jgi:hypothetical protein
MLGYLARAFLLNRLFEGRSRRRGYGGGFGPRRRQSQSNVRVFGCCLPGCAVMTLVPTAAAGMAGRYALRSRRK